jgi:hypothetical protein
MSWTELLNREIEQTYDVTEKLIEMVDDGALDWKPASGTNWMTTGQLLKHLTDACGMAFKGFVTGDWDLPEGTDMSDLSGEQGMPPAEKLPAVPDVRHARRLLVADRKVAREMVVQAGEEGLSTRKATAPWDPTPMLLGHRLLQMVDHLKVHKAQLFYYLKLQGKPVHTGHLWGM